MKNIFSTPIVGFIPFIVILITEYSFDQWEQQATNLQVWGGFGLFYAFLCSIFKLIKSMKNKTIRIMSIFGIFWFGYLCFVGVSDSFGVFTLGDGGPFLGLIYAVLFSIIGVYSQEKN